MLIAERVDLYFVGGEEPWAKARRDPETLAHLVENCVDPIAAPNKLAALALSRFGGTTTRSMLTEGCR